MKPMLSRKSPKPGNQVKSFRKAARELGADESEARFDTALKAVARQKPSKAEQKSKETRR
jgi:hypothetical protein